MANDNTGPAHDRPCPSEGVLPDEVERLIWDWFDGNIDEAGTKRLEAILTSSDADRSKYVKIATLQVELTEHFGRTDDSLAKPTHSPILGSLGNVLPTDAPGLDQLSSGVG